MQRYYLSAALLLAAASPALAEMLDTVVVTATRTAQTTDETLASVTVLTSDDIEQQQAQSVSDLLRGVPGVLIDGVKTGSATTGTAAFEHIPIEQIERIEVVRGPRSSLYGSEAIGGVIQIFTKKGGGSFKPHFSIESGSYNTNRVTAGVSGGGERGWFNLSTSGLNTAGFNACDGKPAPGAAGCRTIEPDMDGYERRSAALRAGYRFTDRLELDAHLLYSTGDNEFDGTTSNASTSMQKSIGGSARFLATDNWMLALAAGRSLDESDNFLDGVFKSSFNTQRDSISLQNDITIADLHLLTLGMDYQEDQVDGTTNYAESSRNNRGLFAQFQGMFGAHDLQLALRRDNNEQFGGHSTGGLAWGYALNDSLRLTASYGTAFKAPTFNELYYPGYGNANLTPETSRSTEFGLSGRPDWGSWSVNVYETRIDDLIAYDSSIFAPANIGQARIRGLEAVVATKLGAWDLNTNLTLLDPRNRDSSANDDNLLPRRTRQSLRIDVDRAFGEYSLGATLLAEGKRYDDLGNTRELDGYTTFDLRGGYALNKDWRIQARIENLFDRDYATAAFFNQPGRSFYLSLSYQPE